LEFGPKELERIFAEPTLRDALIKIGKSVGFQYVTLDLAGYRMAGQSEMESGLIQIASSS
jgi:PP-loop superfamily ATP-utilizing enzyme